ncbi:MAG: hypothetical protein IPO83_15595 [Chitinophagaceae bacterium]|nr:hypothetical protein [Chitinophagaceae bacterium]
MKPVLIAFHLFMIIFYMGVGGSLIFSDVFPDFSGTARNILGAVLIVFSLYRCILLYKKMNS